MIISIRDETPSDHDATRRVTFEVFANSEFGHNGEAELVDLLRENCERSVSLVACSEDAIVGHILFTPVMLVRNLSPRTIDSCLVRLNPLATAPRTSPAKS